MKRKPSPKVIEYNPRFEAQGYRHVRWVENASRGLRLVGFADEIAKAEGCWRSIQHTGWFTDDDQYEKYRGIVYQLPTRGSGDPIYVYGYADPNNDDAALLCFDREVSDKLDAARAADRFAERFAEEERDYREAWDAGRRCEQINDKIKATRTKALALGNEIRILRRIVDKVPAPTVCAMLRGKIISLYHEIQKARKERAELISTFGKRPGFVE